MKKKILKFLIPFLGLTTVAAATAPIIVSCSSGSTPEPTPNPTPDPTPDPSPDPTPDPTPDPSPDPSPQKPGPSTPEDVINGSKPAPGIDQNVFDTILKHTFGEKPLPDESGTLKYENLISKQFQEQALNAQTAKTREEVLQIAQNNLNKITDAELQEALNLNLATGLEMFSNTHDKSNQFNQASISNLNFDKENNKISFDIYVYTTSSLNFFDFKPTMQTLYKHQYRNVKIEPSVIELDNNFIPSIAFATNQPNDASITLVEGDALFFDWNESASYWWNNIATEEQKKPFGTIDKLLKYIESENESARTDIKNKINKPLGSINGKLTIQKGIDYYNFFELAFVDVSVEAYMNGLNPSNEPEPFRIYRDIAFSSMNPETNQSQWQVFKKASSPSPEPTPPTPEPTNPEDVINGSKPAPGIDQNVFDTILKHTFGEKLPPDEYGNQLYENLISKQFQEQALNVQTTKTRDEVLQIAQDNLNKITDAELQEALNLNLAKEVLYKKTDPNSPNAPEYITSLLTQASLSNLKFDTNSHEISFDMNMYISQSSKTNFVSILEFQLQYRFSNIKIKPSVVEINDNFIPSISFDENQPNASLRLVKSDSLNNFLEIGIEAWDKNLVPQDIKDMVKTKENLIKLIQLNIDMINNDIKQCLGKQLGVVDNKFTIRNMTNDLPNLINASFFNVGFIPISEDFAWLGWDQAQQISGPLKTIEIAFSSMNPETNQSQWQVFKKASSPSLEPTPPTPEPTNPEDVINGSKPAPGIDQNVFDTILKHTFGEKLPPDRYGMFEYENLISKQLKQQASNPQLKAKTRDEVLQIAQDNLNKITDAELQEALNLNLAKGISKAVQPYDQPIVLNNLSFLHNASVSNLKFDRKNNEISFDLVVSSFINYDVSNFNGAIQTTYKHEYRNIKIMPSIIETSNNFIPSITFITNQSEHASIKFVKSELNAINIMELSSHIWDKNLLPPSQKEEFKDKNGFLQWTNNEIKNTIQTHNDEVKKTINKPLGIIDGRLTITKERTPENYDFFDCPFVDISDLCALNGWNEYNDRAQSFNIYFDIAFSSMNPETNQSQWQVFKKAI